MGRFSDNGLKKPADKPSDFAEAADALTDSEATEEVSAVNDQKTNEPVNQYSPAQMKPVNVGGFRVPLVVRAHWQSQSKFKGEKVATQLRAFLVERYGLPEGISEDDLIC